MSIPPESDMPPEWRFVHLCEYAEPLDLLGKDLIRMLSRSKEKVATLVGRMADKTEMQTEEMPGELVTSMTGEIADEIHEWPKATFGPTFRHLTLQFREGRLIHIGWKFQSAAAPRTKPWWKVW